MTQAVVIVNRGRRAHRMTRVEIAESDRLRVAVQRAGLDQDTAALADVMRCSLEVVSGWLEKRHHLLPSQQRLLRAAYSCETGGPG